MFPTDLNSGTDYSDEFETRSASTFGELYYCYNSFHLDICDLRNLFSAMSFLGSFQAALVRGYRTSAIVRGGGHGHEGYVRVM